MAGNPKRGGGLVPPDGHALGSDIKVEGTPDVVGQRPDAVDITQGVLHRVILTFIWLDARSRAF